MKNPRSLLPNPLKPGDCIAVIAPAGPASVELLKAGIRFLELKGFRVLEGCYVLEQDGYCAGTDRQRCDDLNAMLANRDVRGILFARGGYGTMHLLDSIHMHLLVSDPIILVGMSDVTALQLSLYKRCNLVTFSGPMIAGQVAQGLDSISETSFMAALTQPLEKRNLWPDESGGIRVLRPGRASGVLLGGCLSLVTALLGTPHLPDFDGAILFLEDVNEPAYRLDRMLTQLHLSGILKRIHGVLLGYFLDSQNGDLSEIVERIILKYVDDETVPVVSGIPHGHALPNITLPLGAPVTLDTYSGSLVADLRW
ncbi:S66 peptidase family protein [Desulfomonile tiedjei]|uniref:Putative MccF-like protein (Microcin C7 resistance) n=1 Tax=Desulfomonile tiedjei (strain ATCC 49306 / DSM 6799 / DCB-1) TaxID=706587 RepID=I4C839_DESTA|nr:LD-carboxypeptidase [Desulfomonile tiedjei]AFM25730.1 putative MccF-like protein (microcin C7 resistance) [Desulfomonile tiedjei DSM 6799]